VCYTTVYRGISSLTLTYTALDSCITYTYFVASVPFLTEPVACTFVSINRWNNEACNATWASASLFRRFTDTNVYVTSSVKNGKLATKYPWIGLYYFLQPV